MSKLAGESESNLRKAFEEAEKVKKKKSKLTSSNYLIF